MIYDVIAVAQVVMPRRPLLSVRIVQAGMSEQRAAEKHRQMVRSTAGTRIDGEETFVIVPAGTYKTGETLTGGK